MSLKSGTAWNDASAEWRAGNFYKDLSPEAMGEFESHAAPFCCEGTRTLFTEKQEPCSVLFLLEETRRERTNSRTGWKNAYQALSVSSPIRK